MSLGVRFCVSRKGGMGVDRLIEFLRPKQIHGMSGVGCRKALVGTGWAISLLHCTNGLRK